MSESEDRKPQRARPSLFLERQSYRRRRLMDAARLLPILGAALIALPLLWPSQTSPEDGVPLSSASLYVFACWVFLIVVSLIFGFAAKRMATGDDPEAESDRWPH